MVTEDEIRYEYRKEMRELEEEFDKNEHKLIMKYNKKMDELG